MSGATVTSKGQVTIPADARRAAGIEAQTRLSFTPMPDGTIVVRVKNRSLLELRGLLKPAAGTRESVDEMRVGRK